MRANLLPHLWGGGDYHRGGIFEGASVRIQVARMGAEDLKTFGVEAGGFEVDEQPIRVVG